MADVPAPSRAEVDGDRDSRTLRRGLRAAVWSAVVVAGPGVLAVLLRDAGGAAGFAVIVLGLGVGSLVGSGWLLLAAALDTHAGQPISAHRWRWTIAMSTAAVVLMVLAPAALGMPSGAAAAR